MNPIAIRGINTPKIIKIPISLVKKFYQESGTILILHHLDDNTLRFSELKKRLGK